MGVYLGPPQSIVKPSQDNLKGYWEHQALTNLNERILARLGGSWHEPPELTSGWQFRPDLREFREEAHRIVRKEFGGKRLWGWKDPRTCLTLPFWQSLLPRMSYVICYRNPIDVARSLGIRDGFTFKKSSDLWLTHVTLSLRHTSGKHRILIPYDDLMNNPGRWLRALCEFLKIQRTRRLQMNVTEFMDRKLQHHHTPVADNLTSREISFPTTALYYTLRLLSDQESNRFHASKVDINFIDLFSETAWARDIELENLISRLRSDLSVRDHAISKLGSELTAIKGSLGYRFMRAYASRIDRLFPDRTRRGRLRLFMTRKLSAGRKDA
jgi:hypothetical protein